MIASGKAISSTIDMKLDEKTGALIVRHDDMSPSKYHSLEMWTGDPDGAALHAAIADRFSGLRTFRSAMPHDGEIAFGRPDSGPPVEMFRYTLADVETMRVDWSIARAGQPLRLGDSLNCRRGAK